MAERRIDLFMWGFQDSFRRSLDDLAKSALELLGAPTEPTAILIGLRKEGGSGHPLCIEPETGPLRPSDFDGLFDRANALYGEDPESAMSYSAAWINEKKHREAHERAIGRAIVERFVDVLGPSLR